MKQNRYRLMSVDVKGRIGGVDSLQKTSDNLGLLFAGLLSNLIKFRLNRRVRLFFGLRRSARMLLTGKKKKLVTIERKREKKKKPC